MVKSPKLILKRTDAMIAPMNCEIAQTIPEIMRLTQDDEGNWGTSDDLDDLEKEE